jgi:hypothetical protein
MVGPRINEYGENSNICLVLVQGLVMATIYTLRVTAVDLITLCEIDLEQGHPQSA